jgi:hypothetical protein
MKRLCNEGNALLEPFHIWDVDERAEDAFDEIVRSGLYKYTTVPSTGKKILYGKL